jgi:rRNA maturation RNase YbeY
MILNQQRVVRLSLRELELFLRRVMKELGIAELQVTVCMVGDAEIAGMNRRFRKKLGPTDVLSFPAMNGPELVGGTVDTSTSRKNPHPTKPTVGHPGKISARRRVELRTVPESPLAKTASGASDVQKHGLQNRVLQNPYVRNARMRHPGVRSATEKSLGDIAIAPGVAKRNAGIYGRTLPAELKILILHGVLHLLGYDHETDRGEMERTETKLRRRLGLA